ncbi:chromate efflux transporter [Devosia sp.]|uniref:chromate efflux transporter n=1 Tax=Devosia sp. TaxID=1871048 RepID=UPI002614F700|nr:chromate efflux transporter [Devosia sp.]
MTDQTAQKAGAGEVFGAFLKLGLTSFGGPIAHLGYFRDAFVIRRKWLSETEYAELVGLCQFLPGPASSQVGFALGLRRAGILGALAAWTGFTLPSALLMIALALGAAAMEGPLAAGILHGLKLVAVAVVAQAVLGMARTLTPDAPRAAIAAGAVLLLAMIGGSLGQIAAILAGAGAGLLLCRGHGADDRGAEMQGLSRRVGVICLAVFAVLLAGLPLVAAQGQGLALFDAFYRAGALVFGGGHVVLPLLEAETVGRGWIGADGFLTGYGTAQAMPGPLFSFAAYLGAAGTPGPNGIAGGLIATVAIFLPGMLLLVGVLPFWSRVRTMPLAQAALAGTNAAVVGILGAALFDPVFTSAVVSQLDLALALAGFVALVAFRAPPWIVVLALALSGGFIGVVG